MRGLVGCLVALATLLMAVEHSFAHALQPGYVEISPDGEESWRVLWRKPDVQGRPMAIDLRLPANCSPDSTTDMIFDGSGWIGRWIAACPGGLAGGTITIPGLDATQTDVLVRYEPEPGDVRTVRMTPDKVSFEIPVEPDRFELLSSYFWLGVDHILEGFDHLLFVFALLLLIPDRWRLLGAITAFTLAHSITLAAATLGYVSLPGPPVEAVIALSIMFLASELVQRDASHARLSERFPWIVSFAFGLLHGFGFAGALEEIGLPRGDLPVALISFNLGVEAGQVFFVAVVLVAGGIVQRILPRTRDVLFRPQGLPNAVMAYAIGGLAAYWFIERVSGFG